MRQRQAHASIHFSDDGECLSSDQGSERRRGSLDTLGRALLVSASFLLLSIKLSTNRAFKSSHT